MTTLDQNYFYVTMLSNSSRDIYDQNKHADFTVKLAQPLELGTTFRWKWENAKFRVPHLPRGKPSPTLL